MNNENNLSGHGSFGGKFVIAAIFFPDMLLAVKKNFRITEIFQRL